jgi:hypothetical protein
MSSDDNQEDTFVVMETADFHNAAVAANNTELEKVDKVPPPISESFSAQNHEISDQIHESSPLQSEDMDTSTSTDDTNPSSSFASTDSLAGTTKIYLYLHFMFVVN